MSRKRKLSGAAMVAPFDDALWHLQTKSISYSPYFRRKAVFDRVLAALLLMPGLPMIGLLVLLIRATSPGPGISRQIRVGQGGREFTMYKIRTMRHDVLVHDNVFIGGLLRNLHLDALPVLLNVLKGDMSFVGPRPERPEFVNVLAEAIPDYPNRLVVSPGITGLAQLNLPPDSDLASVRGKLLLDREYIEQAGMFLDTRLLCCTCLQMLKLPKSWTLAIFGLRRNVPRLAIQEETSGIDDGG